MPNLHSHLLKIFLSVCFFAWVSFIGPDSYLERTIDEPVDHATIAPELKGAWKMVYKDNQDTDSLGIQMVKILSSDHFMFAFFNEKTKKFFSAGGGTYSYADGIYTEHIQFHTIDPEIIGASLSFKCTLEDGKWYHTGAIDGAPMNEVFEPIKSDDRSLLIGAWIMNTFKNAEGQMVQPRRQDTKKNKNPGQQLVSVGSL